MSLDTTTDVEQLSLVLDDEGNRRSPANLTVQKETLAALNDYLPALDNQPSLGAFQHVTSGTGPEKLPANGVPDGVSVLLQAPGSNAGKLYVGNSDSQPIEIQPSGTVTVDVSNTSAITVKATTAGDSVGVLYEDG